MNILITVYKKEYKFTLKEARQVYEELKELFIKQYTINTPKPFEATSITPLYTKFPKEKSSEITC